MKNVPTVFLMMAFVNIAEAQTTKQIVDDTFYRGEGVYDGTVFFGSSWASTYREADSERIPSLREDIHATDTTIAALTGPDSQAYLDHRFVRWVQPTVKSLIKSYRVNLKKELSDLMTFTDSAYRGYAKYNIAYYRKCLKQLTTHPEVYMRELRSQHEPPSAATMANRYRELRSKQRAELQDRIADFQRRYIVSPVVLLVD